VRLRSYPVHSSTLMTTSIKAPPISTVTGRDLGAMAGVGVPLVVDLDGTLLRSDLLWEGLVHLMVKRPRAALGLPRALLGGKAAFKKFVAEESDLSVDHIPFESATVAQIERARSSGQPIVVASGAHQTQARAVAGRIGAVDAWGSNGEVSLTGAAKLERIRAQYPEFDYIGDSMADIPLWKEARNAVGVNLRRSTLRKAQRVRPDFVALAGTRRTGRAWRKALRPHQWAKNALLILPVLAAHVELSAGLVLTLVLGFLAFSFLASAVYLVNDVVDVSHDRIHPSKRNRPIAAGEITIPSAILGSVVLTACALGIAQLLPSRFAFALGAYLVVTASYSFVLKRRAILDVITLAALYTMRVVAGALLVGVPLSRWFLAFSIFFFFSLALVKRVVELGSRPADDRKLVAGRGYSPLDLPVLTSLGTAAVGVSSLVYCLYITSEDVVRLYSTPDFLWAGLPILLYWQARIWLLTGRGAMDEDPVVFALRDRISHLLFLSFMGAIWLAAAWS